jgi:hypothetical protein
MALGKEAPAGATSRSALPGHEVRPGGGQNRAQGCQARREGRAASVQYCSLDREIHTVVTSAGPNVLPIRHPSGLRRERA